MVSILSFGILSDFQYIENQSTSSVNEYRFKGKSAYVINAANEAVVVADLSFQSHFKKNSHFQKILFIDCNKPHFKIEKLKNIEVYLGNQDQIFIKTVNFTIGLKRTHKKNVPYSIIWLKKVNSDAAISIENSKYIAEHKFVQKR